MCVRRNDACIDLLTVALRAPPGFAGAQALHGQAHEAHQGGAQVSQGG